MRCVRLACWRHRARMVMTKAGCAIFRSEDRRRRPVMILPRATGQAWIAQGRVVAAGGDGFCLAEADGERQEVTPSAEADYPAAPQGQRTARPWGLEREEAIALERLSGDLEAAEMGALRGVDWSAPPQGRGAGQGRDPMAAGAAARGRAKRALSALATPLALAVKAVCSERVTLEILERRFQWPARSGRLAVKLAAAQLAHHYRFSAP